MMCTLNNSIHASDHSNNNINVMRTNQILDALRSEIDLNFGRSSSHFEINVTKTKHFAIKFSKSQF